jgi:glutathione S-transferase
MKLYYAETINPRKACAVARYLDSPVEFVRVDLLRGEHKSPKFLAMNPNGKVPVLQEGDECLWEANAIMCRLSDVAQSDLWPHDARQMDVLRWLSWDAQHFTRSGGTLYFENFIKPRIGLGDADPGNVKEAMTNFRTYAQVLEAHLRNRAFLVGDALTVADFAVASALPYAQEANLPIPEFPAITRWYATLEDLSAWREPFPLA